MSLALHQATHALIDSVGDFVAASTTGDLVAGSAAAETLPAPLNSFGTAFTVVSWVLLLGLNLWCFLRLLSGPRERRTA